MSDDTAPDTAPVSGEVAAIAAEALSESAHASATVGAIAENVETAVEEIEQQIEDETEKLWGHLNTQQAMLNTLAETVTALPGTIAAAISAELKSLLPKISEGLENKENPVPMPENPVAPATVVTETVKENVPPKKGLHFL